MAAPKNYKKKPNGKNATGRPSAYKPEYCQEIINYFNVPAFEEICQETISDDGTITKTPTGKYKPNILPYFVDFAAKIGVCVDTLNEWTKNIPEFSEAYKKAKEFQERNWQTCSLLGLYSPAFTIFFGKNIFHWKDSIHNELTGKDGGPIETKSTMTLDEATQAYMDGLK